MKLSFRRALLRDFAIGIAISAALVWLGWCLVTSTRTASIGAGAAGAEQLVRPHRFHVDDSRDADRAMEDWYMLQLQQQSFR